MTKNNGQLGKVESYIGAAKQWTQKFSYDSLGRLSEANEYRGDNSQLSYKQKFDFDRFGNLYRKQSSNPAAGQATPLPYTPIEDADINKSTNRLATGATYDDAGNVTQDTKFRGLNYSYDANGRMYKTSNAAIPANPPLANSVYDSAGQRVATQVDGVWTFFVYDAFGKMVAEYGGLHFAGEFLLNNYAVKAPVIRDILHRVESNPIFVSPHAAPPLETFEAKIEDVQGRGGYVSEFLGEGEFKVPLPEFGDGLRELAAVVNQNESGMDKFMLDYTHFSIVMHEKRRMAIFTASNIDGAQSRKIKRKKDKWGFDPRISKDFQLGNDLYAGNDLDRGHLVRRLDPVWGSEAEAQRAEIDTFFFTNCTPQHSSFNQKTWLSLEEYLLDNVDTRDFKACIFTGPIFSGDDRPYRDALLPLAYWKVMAMIHDTRNELSATAYIISQRELVSNKEFVFGQFKTYQTSIGEIERRTNLNFGELKKFDPFGQQESVGFRELPMLEVIRL